MKSAANTVLNGLVANLFIPGGVGDISYRTLSDSDNKSNFFKSLHNALAQFLPTVLVGTMGFAFLPFFAGYNYLKVIMSLVILLVVVLFLSKNNNRDIAWLSFARYAVFMIQCYLLFYIFSVHSIPYLDLWKYIALFFLIRTLIPSFLMVELGVRASLSILVFGAFENDLGNIIVIFSTLLIVNNYLPALIFKTFGLSWLKKLSFS